MTKPVVCGILALHSLCAQSFDERLHAIMSRAEYRHSRFGVEVLDLESGRIVYQMNANQLFVPGSTTKLLTMGTALAVLGPDYRFHTKVERSGPVDAKGTVKGDLVLVAGGDPNLSNRIRPDGTLAFENVDHSYSPMNGAKVVEGDPLAVIRELAKQVGAKGIKRIEGAVRVDATLFPEGERELGTGVVLSPMVVNDNLVDVTVTPGAKEGDPASAAISPQTAYTTFLNHAKTGAPGSERTLHYGADIKRADGSHEVTIEGSVPANGKPVLSPYRVPEPSVFASVALREALRAEGISVVGAAFATSASGPREAVAEHVSPPLIEEARVLLKVSQNLHASMMPYLVGALAGHVKQDMDQAGFDLEHGFLEKAGLDVTGASQSDGAGGDAFFTPDFMVHFLAFMTKQPYFDGYYRALPILGKDGTLWDIQPDSPAAGWVHAKTGTYATYNALNKNLVVTGKGLAGYVTTKSGQRFSIAIYANFIPADSQTGTHMVGDALGEIAAAAYDSSF